MKKDCIFCKNNKCKLLKEDVCKNSECSFYKKDIIPEEVQLPYKSEDIKIPDNFRRKSSGIL